MGISKKKTAEELEEENRYQLTYHENGKMKEAIKINKIGERHGLYRSFHENGGLQVEVNYINGIQDEGTLKSYHDNGRRAFAVIELIENLNGEFSDWSKNNIYLRKGDVVKFNNGRSIYILGDYNLAAGGYDYREESE